MTKKRKLFDELMDGVAAMRAEREGKITLRTYKVEARTLPAVKPRMIKEVRERFRCSRSVFARKLFTNQRTLEKWEQGRAKPNAQAVALLLLAAKYPDTFDRLEQLAR
jgi:putative transcriptional regulator